MPSQFNPIKMQAGGAPMPYISGISRLTGELDPLSKQLLFGLGGRGGFIPGAMRAAERTCYDADGNPVMQGIDQSKLVPLLTAALQEAITKIETLETKVAALEAE